MSYLLLVRIPCAETCQTFRNLSDFGHSHKRPPERKLPLGRQKVISRTNYLYVSFIVQFLEILAKTGGGKKIAHNNYLLI